jgi:hypothetical protein
MYIPESFILMLTTAFVLDKYTSVSRNEFVLLFKIMVVFSNRLKISHVLSVVCYGTLFGVLYN